MTSTLAELSLSFSISCDFTDLMSLIRDKGATLHHTSDTALSPAADVGLRRLPTLLRLVGGERLLQ